MAAKRARKTKPTAKPTSSAMSVVSANSDVLIPVVVALVVFGLAVSMYSIPSMILDAHNYTMSAQRLVRDGVFALAAGQLPGIPVPADARVTPGYVLFLAAFHGLLGRSGDVIEAIKSVTPIVLAAQFVLAIVGVAFIALSGRELGGKRVGLIAGLMASVYLPFAWSTSVTLAESIAAPLLAFQLWLALRILRRDDTTRTLWVLFGFGVLSGVVAMVRPSMIAWALVPLIYAVVLRVESWKRLLMLVAVAALGFLLVFAPWWVRNYQAIGVFVPIRTGFVKTEGGALAPVSTETVAPPTNGQQGRIALGVAGTAWTAPDDVLWENNFRYTPVRVEFGDYPLTTHDTLVPLMRAMGYYQIVLWILAAFSLLLVRRAPRILVVLSVPVYAYASHYATQLSPRYVYLGMPALIVAAASGAYLIWHYVSRAARSRSAAS